MLVRRLSNRQLLSLHSSGRIGSGGEALVFAIAGDSTSVVKLYHKPTSQRAQKLAVMIVNPPDDPMAAQGHVSIAWPTDTLISVGDNERFVGFVMPRVAALRQIFEVYNPGVRRLHCPLFNYMYLLRAARNLAAAFRALHARRYVVGDVNECNTLVADSALVSLLDTDSFQVRDPKNGAIFRCPVGRAEFTPPELQGMEFDRVDRRPEHDLFGLGVLIFQLLMGGQHPFNGVPVARGDSTLEARIQKGHFAYGKRCVPYKPNPAAIPFSTVAPSLQQLFIDCFESGYNDPAQRPAAETWQSALQKEEESLLHCSRNNQHFYSNHLTACPWCERASRFGIDPFPSRRAVEAGQHLSAAAQQVPLPNIILPTRPFGAPPPPVFPPLPKAALSPRAPLRNLFKWVVIGLGVLMVWAWIQQSMQQKPTPQTSYSSTPTRPVPSVQPMIIPTIPPNTWQPPPRSTVASALPSQVPSAAPAVQMAGERFPQTRQRLMNSSEVKTWTEAQIRYAINEMYARHGAGFRDPQIARVFLGMPWYQLKPGLTYAEAKKSFTSVEVDNVKLLGFWRDARKAGVRPEVQQRIDELQAKENGAETPQSAAPPVSRRVAVVIASDSRGLNLRVDHTAKSPVVATLYHGDQVFLDNGYFRNDEPPEPVDWQHVTTMTGRTGWIRADYVTASGADNGSQ
ncbi:MAG TPA: YARHG domain-containing protein [Chthoniobacterales bacterium]|jgi:hypothetical protein|nr:YARHG domain-containing protein [Chthoniobacterales bacterium]